MKQKMLGGAALVMTASVNSFAGSSSGEKEGKKDCTKVDSFEDFDSIEINKTKINDLAVDKETTKKVKDLVLENIKTTKDGKKSFEITLAAAITGQSADTCIFAKVSLPEEKKIKFESIENLSGEKKDIEPGWYVSILYTNNDHKLKFNFVVLEKKSKLTNNDGKFVDQDSK